MRTGDLLGRHYSKDIWASWIELVLTAAAQAQEAVGQDAAFEEGVELVLDESRQVDSCLGLSLREEGRRVLLHQAVQRGPLRPVPLVVDRGATRRGC